MVFDTVFRECFLTLLGSYYVLALVCEMTKGCWINLLCYSDKLKKKLDGAPRIPRRLVNLLRSVLNVNLHIADCGANEGNLFFSIYCIRLGRCEDEYLKQASELKFSIIDYQKGLNSVI